MYVCTGYIHALYHTSMSMWHFFNQKLEVLSAPPRETITVYFPGAIRSVCVVPAADG